MTDGMKATRQPQARKSASGGRDRSETTPEDKQRPMAKPICGRLENKPRLCGGAYSYAINTAPPHSPPRPMPCKRRSTTSMMGAANADLLISWKAPDQNRGDSHDHQCRDQNALSADLVAEVTKDQSAERASHETNGEGRVRQKDRHDRIGCRKEELIEDNACHGTIQKEIVHSMVAPIILAITT